MIFTKYISQEKKEEILNSYFDNDNVVVDIKDYCFNATDRSWLRGALRWLDGGPAKKSNTSTLPRDK